MRTNRISLEVFACSRCLKTSYTFAPHYHSRRLSRKEGCTWTNCFSNRTQKSRQKHQTVFISHAAHVSQPPPIPEGDWLPEFISWLHANGASGVNQPGAKLAQYEEEAEAGNPPNRGLLFIEAVEDVTAEAPLLRVPLRLGIWDKGAQIHKQCPGLTELGCLALALLEEVSQGSSSQRWPWLRVLPREVPSLYGTLPVELHPELEGFVPAADLDKARNRAAQESAAAAPRSGAFCVEQWRWALSVVHSRALAVPALDGIIVPMLIPMVDMINHGNHAGSSIPDVDGEAGSRSNPLAQDAAGPSENVRWQVNQSEQGDWEVQIVATRQADPGEEALFSYGARSQSSSYFMLHYGFVPVCNSYDEAILFTSLQEALDWVLQKCQPETLDAASRDALQERRRAAEEKADNIAKKASDGTALHPDELDKLSLLKIYTRGRLQAVDGRLVAALQALHGGAEDAEAYAKAVVGTRCRELLAQTGWTSLREDLQSLIQGSNDWSQYWEETLQKCERAWELEQKGSFREALCERGKGDGSTASSESTLNVIALRASQKLILWTYLLSQPPARV